MCICMCIHQSGKYFLFLKWLCWVPCWVFKYWNVAAELARAQRVGEQMVCDRSGIKVERPVPLSRIACVNLILLCLCTVLYKFNSICRLWTRPWKSMSPRRTLNHYLSYQSLRMHVTIATLRKQWCRMLFRHFVKQPRLPNTLYPIVSI